MTKDSDDDLRRAAGIVTEDLKDQLDRILELAVGTDKKLADLPTRDEHNEVKGDIKIIKADVTDTSKEVHQLDKRMTRLEAAA